jgi:multimeric flavodoxin WrbA
MSILMVVGSRNPAGQTARAANALLEGVASAGGQGQTVLLPPLRLERCRQCDLTGWGRCRQEGRCVIDDDFAAVVDRLRAATAVVLASPVYWGDLSESLRAFLDRLRRIARHEQGKAGVAGKRAVGVCVAGGGGGGAPTCLVSMERVLGHIGLDTVDLVPVRRQNLEMKLEVLRTVGRWLVTDSR